MPCHLFGSLDLPFWYWDALTLVPPFVVSFPFEEVRDMFVDYSLWCIVHRLQCFWGNAVESQAFSFF